MALRLLPARTVSLHLRVLRKPYIYITSYSEWTRWSNLQRVSTEKLDAAGSAMCGRNGNGNTRRGAEVHFGLYGAGRRVDKGTDGHFAE